MIYWFVIIKPCYFNIPALQSFSAGKCFYSLPPGTKTWLMDLWFRVKALKYLLVNCEIQMPLHYKVVDQTDINNFYFTGDVVQIILILGYNTLLIRSNLCAKNELLMYHRYKSVHQTQSRIKDWDIQTDGRTDRQHIHFVISK